MRLALALALALTLAACSTVLTEDGEGGGCPDGTFALGEGGRGPSPERGGAPPSADACYPVRAEGDLCSADDWCAAPLVCTDRRCAP